MEWRAKQVTAPQQLTPVSRGLYEGQLVVWDVPDAHGDVFSASTDFYIYGEPYVFLEHNYFSAPVGRIIYHVRRDDGLYVGIKLDSDVENEVVEGLHLSVGGFARGYTRDDGYFQITQFALFEASLTRTPAQPNKQLVLLMKTLSDMATENEKTVPDNAGAQVVPKVAMQASALGYVKKQDLAQLEAFVNELAARVEVMESLQVQVDELQKRVAELEAVVSQLQGMTQEAVSQSVGKALKVVEEQVQPFAKEIAKTVLLVAEALKKTNAQRI